MCENCYFYKIDKYYHSIDCLNVDIDQENYFNHLGENKEGCPYFKERIEINWMQD